MPRPPFTLLAETIDKMSNAGYQANDIAYIGSRDGHSCTWDEYRVLADVTYDSGYGGQEVASDLEIHFRDGAWLARGEYDGSEWWDLYVPMTSLPVDRRPITTLLPDGPWRTLADAAEDLV